MSRIANAEGASPTPLAEHVPPITTVSSAAPAREQQRETRPHDHDEPRTPRRRVTTAIGQLTPPAHLLTSQRPACFLKRKPQPIRRDPSVLDDSPSRGRTPGFVPSTGQRHDQRMAAALGRRDLGTLSRSAGCAGPGVTASTELSAASAVGELQIRAQEPRRRHDGPWRRSDAGHRRAQRGGIGCAAAPARPVHALVTPTEQPPGPGPPRASET